MLARRDANELTEEVAFAKLDEFWKEAELDSHPYASIYREKAEEVVDQMRLNLEGDGTESVSGTFDLELSNGVVRLKIDSIIERGTGSQKKAIVTKFKTGKQPKKVLPEDSDAITLKAMRESFPESEILLERVYLGDNSSVEVSITDRVIKNRIEKYEKSIEGIRKGIFPPKPGENDCAHCANYFICPSGS